jgi:adenylate kinase
VNVLLLGPQGSGKGTQAKRVAEAHGVPHIATGDMLREAVAAGTPLGVRVRPILESGRLVPDDLMIELIRERLEQPDTEAGFVLDGFPRTLAQADALDKMFGEIGRDLDVVFEFQLSDDVARERMVGRARQENRSDDTPEAIATRLRLYHDQTEPVVEHYRATGKLVGIHADRSVGEVFGEIERALDALESSRSGGELAGTA